MTETLVPTAADLVATAGDSISPERARLIEEAYEFARDAHDGQNRATGEPYIVHPINGDTYPKVDPKPGKISSAYVTFSFSTTCASNGQVEWGVDGDIHGEAKFYDQYSTQYVYKLPPGTHVFWVRSTCGENKVQFKVG